MTGVILGWWSVQIAIASTHFNERRLTWERIHVGQATVEWPNDNVVETLRTCQGTYGVADYGDVYSTGMRREAEAAGFVAFAHHHSAFRMVPPSTLQVYLDTDVDYYRCANSASSGQADKVGQ